MNAVQKLRSMVGEIRDATQPAKQQEAWDLVSRLLGRMPVNPADVARICQTRDLAALDNLITRIETPGRAPSTPAPGSSGGPPLTEEMEHALKAFKKRLKLTRLSDESKLGGRQLSGGKKSEIDAIIPPTDFPAEVWAALAKAGKLKHTGSGFYALPAGDTRI